MSLKKPVLALQDLHYGWWNAILSDGIHEISIAASSVPSEPLLPLLWPAQLNDDLALLPIADLPETFIFALVYRRLGSLALSARQFINTVIETTSSLVSTRFPPIHTSS